MSPQKGRTEKRVWLAVPVEISKLWDPAGAEHTITENVCSVGMRVLTRKLVEPKERLVVRCIGLDLQLVARVVYRQRMPDGRYGVGLQVRGLNVSVLSTLQGSD